MLGVLKNKPASGGQSQGDEQQPLNIVQELPNAIGQQIEIQSERKRTTALQSTLDRSLKWLKFSISITIFVNVIYSWLLWYIPLTKKDGTIYLLINSGLTQACLFSGIESPAWLSRSVLLFMAITFLLLVISYKFVSALSREWIRYLKFIMFFWGIVLIIFAILSFIIITGGGALDTKNKIENLTQIVQEFYANECSTGTPQECIDSKYSRNSLAIAIFHLANGILIFVIFGQLINMDIPANFRPISTSRRIGQEKFFVTFDKRYTNPNPLRQKDKDIEESSNKDQIVNVGDPQIKSKEEDLQLKHLGGEPNPLPFQGLRRPYN